MRLYQGHDPNAEPDPRDEPDPERLGEWWDQRALDLDEGIVTDCPVCGADGACGWDDEGRALIHSLSSDDAAESAVEEVVGG